MLKKNDVLVSKQEGARTGMYLLEIFCWGTKHLGSNVTPKDTSVHTALNQGPSSFKTNTQSTDLYCIPFWCKFLKQKTNESMTILKKNDAFSSVCMRKRVIEESCQENGLKCNAVQRGQMFSNLSDSSSPCMSLQHDLLKVPTFLQDVSKSRQNVEFLAPCESIFVNWKCLFWLWIVACQS